MASKTLQICSFIEAEVGCSMWMLVFFVYWVFLKHLKQVITVFLNEYYIVWRLVYLFCCATLKLVIACIFKKVSYFCSCINFNFISLQWARTSREGLRAQDVLVYCHQINFEKIWKKENWSWVYLLTTFWCLYVELSSYLDFQTSLKAFL